MDDRGTFGSGGNETIFFSGVFLACNYPGLISPDDCKISIVLTKL